MSRRGVLTVTGILSGCELWRVAWPTAVLQAQGYPVAWQHRTAPPPADMDRYAALVWARLSWTPEHYADARAWRDDLHRQGLAVLYELDDDMISPAHEQQAAVRCPHLTAAEIEQQRQDRLYALRLCDGVTVPTVALAQVVEQYTDRPVAVVPNAIPWEYWRRECRKGSGYGDGLTIGWAGGPRHDADFVEMAEAWGRIAARYPDVQFALMGYWPAALIRAVSESRLSLTQWASVEIYPQWYRGIDIMCCPLADTPFNRCKSPIKAFEAAAAGAAVVASPTVYGRAMRHAITGILASTADEWECALADMLDPTWRRPHQVMVQDWATRVRTRHNLDTDASAWPRAWGKLIGAARVPRA